MNTITDRYDFPETVVTMPLGMEGEGEYFRGGMSTVFIPYGSSKMAWKTIEIAKLKPFGSDIYNLQLDLTDLTEHNSQYALSYKDEKRVSPATVTIAKFRLRDSSERRLLLSYRELQALKSIHLARQQPLLARNTRGMVEYKSHSLGVTKEGKLVLYMGIEMVEGNPLHEYLRGNLSLESQGTVIKTLCDSVEAMHSLGIEHRDLKPENVIFNGRAKIIDFGLAHVDEYIDVEDMRIDALRERKVYGRRILGTPAYMAPEQIMGKPEMNSDLYSLGIMIHEILLGHPFPLLLSGELICHDDFKRMCNRYQFNQQCFDSIGRKLWDTPKGKVLRRVAGNLVEDALVDLLCSNPQARSLEAAKELGMILSGDGLDIGGTAQQTIRQSLMRSQFSTDLESNFV